MRRYAWTNTDYGKFTPDSAARTIFVDNGGIKATDFGLTTEQQQMLFDNGQNAARRWLANPSG